MQVKTLQELLAAAKELNPVFLDLRERLLLAGRLAPADAPAPPAKP